MLPSTNLFKSIFCPYYQVGFCQRPYCHFKDEKLPSSQKASISSAALPAFPQSAESRKRSYEEKPTDKESYPTYTPSPSYCPTPLALLAQISRPTTSSASFKPSRISRQESQPTESNSHTQDLKPLAADPNNDDILGDLDDMSDEESCPGKGETSDLLTTILLNGQKSGVLGNVDPFELEVSKNKVRLLEKRQEEKEKRHQAEICDKNLTTDNLQNKEITEQVTSKSDVSNLDEIQSEIEKLEQRRKLLEDYFRSKNMIGPGSFQNSSPKSDAKESLSKKDAEEPKDKSSRNPKSHKNHDIKHRSHSSSKNQVKRASTSDDSHSRSGHSDLDKTQKAHSKKKKKEKDRDRDKDEEKDRGRNRDRDRDRVKDRDRNSQNKSESGNKKPHRDKEEKSEERKPHRSSKHKHKDRERRKDGENEKDKSMKSKSDRKKGSCRNSPPHDEDVLKFLAQMSKLDKQNCLNYDDFMDSPKEKCSRSISVEEVNNCSEDSTKSVKSIESIFNDSPLPDFNEELNLLPNEINNLLDQDNADSSGSDHDYELNQSGSDDEDEDVDEDEADEDQLREIFEEFNPETPEGNPSQRKAHQLEHQKSTSKEDNSSTLNKKRVAHASSNQSETRISNNRRQISNPSKIMMERYKKIQAMQDFNNVELQLENLMEGKSSQVIEVPGSTTTKISGTSKIKTRVAHAPSIDVNRAPRIVSEGSCKVPTQIRQRYLNTFVQECLTIYRGNKECAYERAVAEEMGCYKKAPNRQLYLNIAVNCLKRLRSEVTQLQPVSSSSNGRYIPGDSNQKPQLTTHLQVLAGKPGTIGSWSIEKRSNRDELDPDNFSEEVFVIFLRRYLLSSEDLESNGYPVEDPNIKGGALVSSKPFFRTTGPQPDNPLQRRCDRCGKIYHIDKKGNQVEKSDNCIYHWGRLYTNKGNRATGHVSNFSCCNGDAQSDGCQVHPVHVSDIMELRNFVRTRASTSEEDPVRVYALDCEMCSTTMGNELTRVTIINWEGKTVYESLVRPDNVIIDFNTRFSGIREGDLEGVTTNFRDVQAVLLSMFSSTTILIGHSLESDLKALRILHSQVVDTSVVFPHKMGPPYKRALRNLASEYLQRIIQSDVGGHDSAEDALACLDLMRFKVKQDIKKMIVLRKKQAANG